VSKLGEQMKRWLAQKPNQVHRVTPNSRRGRQITQAKGARVVTKGK